MVMSFDTVTPKTETAVVVSPVGDHAGEFPDLEAIADLDQIRRNGLSAGHVSELPVLSGIAEVMQAAKPIPRICHDND